MKLAQSELDRLTPFASAHRTLAMDSLQSVNLAMLTERASDHVYEQLIRHLARIAGRALTSLFSPPEPSVTSTAYYARFIAHLTSPAGCREVQTAFPVLPSLLDQSAQRWVGALDELLQRVVSDATLLSDRLGGSWDRIDSLRGGLGDSHRNGRTVWEVTNADGISIAYKPRPLGPEAYVYERLAMVDAPIPTVVDRGQYGWVEWLESTPVTNVDQFWKTVGNVAAVCYLEGVGDLHYGNIVISNNGIVPIDLECALHPGQDPEDPVAECVADSILATGLFPGWFGQDGPVARDNSGLFGRRHHTDGRRYQVWDALGTDGMRMVEILGRGISEGEPALLPDGREVPLDRDLLGAALERTLNQLSLDDTSVDHSIEPRHLVRDTGTYARLISQLLDPETLADPAAHVAAAHDLPALPERFVDRIDEAGQAALIEAEAAALMRLDVPLHRSRGRDIVLDDDTVLTNVFDRSGSERRERRVTRLGHTPGGFHRNLVSMHLDHGVGFASSQPLPKASPTSATEAVQALAHQLQENTVGGSDNPTWLELELFAGGTQATGRVGSTSLYDGSAGIAIALAAASYVCGDDELEATSVRVLDISDERAADQAKRAATAEAVDDIASSFLDRVSWPSKTAGLGVARLAVGQILGRTDLIDAAGRTLKGTLQIPITHGDRLDVVGGWAGLLASGLAAFEATGDAELEVLLSARTTELVAEAHVQAADPITGRRLAGLGVAHRGSGLALVAARAASTLGHGDAAAFARQMFAYEDERVERRSGIGAALQRTGDISRPRPGWCAGIAGYLAVRTSTWVTELHDTPRRHLDASIDALGGPLAEDRAGLCCGDAGVLMALTHAAEVGQVPSATAPANEYESRLISFAAGQTPISMVPGYAHHGSCLHMGLGGLAYALAYRCAPGKIPNLLLVA